MEFINKILQGDCRDVLKNIPDESISACITDPPYNYEFIGHTWDDDEIKRRIQRVQDSNTLVKNIPYGSGLAGGVRNENWYSRVRQNILDYGDWCYEWGQEAYRVLKPGGIIAVFNSTRTMAHVQIALERAGFYARDCIVYRRHSGIPKGLNLKSQLKRRDYADYEAWDGWHSCLRNEWEAIVILQKPLQNNYINTFLKYDVGLFYTQNEDGSFQSNIIENIPREKNTDFNVHCTVKPLALMEKLVQMFVPPSDKHIVLDPFAGSGTTLLAARNLGRSFVGIEIVSDYIEIIEQRLSAKKFDDSLRPVSEDDLDTNPNDQPYNLPLFD
ncbi:MAG: DNA methyltransferase [Anaerolineae bacterium]|nr:DNA methyltransferase [Anaerolineae bacterium]MDQ7033629.1 DNA methyltransferase [Anaerolineae bacterium]